MDKATVICEGERCDAIIACGEMVEPGKGSSRAFERAGNQCSS